MDERRKGKKDEASKSTNEDEGSIYESLLELVKGMNEERKFEREELKRPIAEENLCREQEIRER